VLKEAAEAVLEQYSGSQLDRDPSIEATMIYAGV